MPIDLLNPPGREPDPDSPFAKHLEELRREAAEMEAARAGRARMPDDDLGPVRDLMRSCGRAE